MCLAAMLQSLMMNVGKNARRLGIWLVASLLTQVACAAPPREADPARLILKVRRILATADVQCQGRVAMAPDEAVLLGVARKGVRAIVDAKQFHEVERELSAEVAIESKDPAFCGRSARMKPVLIDRVRSAASQLGVDLMGL